MRWKFFSSLVGFVFCLTFSAAAQQAISNGNRLSGTILDATLRQPLSFATVAVWLRVNGKDSLLTGSQTNEQGLFTISNLPTGNLNVQVTFVGYQTLNQPIKVSQSETSLGPLSLKPDASTLKEVKVVAEKSAISMTMEKRTFNVGKNLTTTGGTAESVLKNVPFITLDESGNPSLRNMAITIYVNGKPTQLTLAQIPANQIESVEVISNLSARYDASTSGELSTWY
ncbi:carboxypeptidase-like regulatory domain-containing protein [Spirosoma flavum]|uniref:Carboxypeptidase-like regulatory domain-containing protein n=1 Tax=Spirosoma flavum TaxID=2048557 RepID=A0ABW6AHH2_9BACT